MNHREDPGIARVLGAILLIAGSCIGGGMLGMPVVTGLAGFIPSVVAFVIAWAFMTSTALLLLEVNIWLGTHISIVSMAGRTLGKIGQAAAWILFCYLFYLLLVSYSAGSGAFLADFVEDYIGVRPPAWMGSLVCMVVFGAIVYMGTRPVDLINRLFMAGLIISYLLLVGFGARHVQSELLEHSAWKNAILAAPVLVISFGFHNMIPSLTRYLHGHVNKLRITVLVGSILALVIYLLWEWVILGIVPAYGENSFADSLVKGDLATHALRRVAGKQWVSLAAEWFSFFAIVTSYLAQALSLLHFLADGFHTPNTKRWRAALCALIVVPPFFAALYDPTIFIEALALAGAFGAVILFGIMPALMVWVARYRERAQSPRMLIGGRPVLVLLMLISVGVIVVQILRQMGAV